MSSAAQGKGVPSAECGNLVCVCVAMMPKYKLKVRISLKTSASTGASSSLRFSSDSSSIEQCSGRLPSSSKISSLHSQHSGVKQDLHH